MQLNSPIANVLHQVLGTDINIIYQPIHNAFDHILFLANQESFFYIVDKDNTKYHTVNSAVLPTDYVNLYSYNVFCTNNPFECVDNSLSRSMHINTLICLHSPKPAHIKKEDRAILNQHLWNHHKVFFQPKDLEDWQLRNKVHTINYGIPLEHISYSIPCNSRTKDVLLIGEPGHPTYETLRTAITSANYSCDILRLDMPSLSIINDTLNQYRIAVDLTNGGWVNCLCAVAAGCYSIHNTAHSADLASLVSGHSLEMIMEHISQILKSYQNTSHLDRIQTDRAWLKQQYSFDVFKHSINHLIEILSKKEVYIA